MELNLKSGPLWSIQVEVHRVRESASTFPCALALFLNSVMAVQLRYSRIDGIIQNVEIDSCLLGYHEGISDKCFCCATQSNNRHYIFF